MKFSSVFLVLAALVAVSIAQQETKIIIDDFFVEQTVRLISSSEITPGGPTQTESNSVTQNGDGEILGGARDMSVTFTRAPQGFVLTSDIKDGEWENSVPVSSDGIIFIQYDGNDGSINLDQDGLGGIDLTNNLGSEIFVTISSDISATYTMLFYSASGGNPCSVDFEVPPDNVVTDFIFEFDSDFSGSCDFGNIGAIEVEADASERVDSTMSFFGVRGDIPVTASPTRTPTPNASSAPTPSPSSTRTPDAVVPSDCHCQCPAFTCELIFDPDDDENNAYYFDDDDDNVNAGAGSSSSDASTVKVAFTAGLVVVLAALL